MPKLRPIPNKEEKTDKPESETQVEQTVNTPVDAGSEEPIVEIEEPEAEDAVVVLQNQLDDLRKSEEIQKNRANQAERGRQEALIRAQQREAEIYRFRNEAAQSQYDAIGAALSAATAEAEKAQQDIENAVTSGEVKLQSEAYRRLARAEANISKLEDGKIEIETRARQQAAQPQVQPQAQSTDPLDRANLPDMAKNWLRGHPEYLTDHRKNAKIQALHWDVLDEGHESCSPAYFESLERHLGLRAASQQTQQQPQRTSIVSAPVSRDIPNGSPNRSSSKITLSASQKEAAKISGISEVEYAKQLQKFNEMKASGMIQGSN